MIVFVFQKIFVRVEHSKPTMLPRSISLVISKTADVKADVKAYKSIELKMKTKKVKKNGKK